VDPTIGAHPQYSELRRDSAQGARNAVRLGTALSLSWVIALVTQLFMRRRLGPFYAGRLDFAEGMATLALITLSFGIDTYVRKEVAVRPNHAGDFIGSVTLLRGVVGVLLVAISALVLKATGKPGAVIWLVVLFGLAQFFVYSAATYAAILQALGNIRTLSVVNVLSKLLWGLAIVGGLLAGVGPIVVPTALIASEMVKAVVLGHQAGREVALPLRWRPGVVAAVGLASLPFLATELNVALSAYLDPVFLSYLSNDREVGWYGAGSKLAGLALVLAPVIQWVLLPVASRAAARSADELLLVVRRSFRLVISVAIPLSVMLIMGADLLVRLALGPEYANSVPVIRILAPMFILTYAAILAATFLIRTGRGWFVAATTLFGIVLNSILNVVFIPLAYRDGAAGAAGRAAAVAFVLSEAGVTVILLAKLGRSAFDWATVRVIMVVAGIGLGILGVDHLLGELGWLRLGIDSILYLSLLLLLRVFDLQELRRLFRSRGAT
jgi:O-antigen/teichoic acid export membrane protein